MKYIVCILIGFLLKLSLYEVSNYYYAYLDFKHTTSDKCKVEQAPHLCAHEIVSKSNVVKLLSTIDTNMDLWECQFGFTTISETPTLCKILHLENEWVKNYERKNKK